MRIRLALAATVLVTMAGLAVQTATAQEREERSRHRPLRTAGEPGRVAAADWSLARRSREEGQWTAFRDMVGPGALLHQASGPVDAATWLSGRGDPAEAEQWAPSTAWTSCDGTLAVTEGRYRQPDGLVGTYVTVWALQRNRSYKWTYDLSSADNPQPVARARPALPAVSPNDLIEVVDIPSVRGHVADCPLRGAARPARPQEVPGNATRAGSGASDDATLVWRWEHRANGERLFSADYLHEGTWQRVTELRVAPETPPA
ncbi:MAG: hypothetical protein ABIT10_10140 [Alteraurantiacibacter sp.]